MFQKPVQYVTTETISKLGIGHVETEVKKQVIEKEEMSLKQASPIYFLEEKKSEKKMTVLENKTKEMAESSVLENGKVKRFRGDHILWIE